LHYTAATETAAALFLRALGTPVTGQDVFISFVFSPVHGAEAPNSFFNFFITDNANSTHDGYGVGMYNGSKLGAGVGLDMFADPRTQAIPDPPVTPANGTIYHLVASLKWNEETSLYDSVSFWLNPTRDSFGTPDAEASQSTNLTGSFTRVGIRVANINNGSEYLFDSFIVATEWSDVVPEGVGPSVPEPATWALIFASAGFVLTILKRSQRKQ
jgi:hypothetical protein